VLALALLLLATGGEFVSESLDLRFESVDALGFLRECRLEFVDAVAQDLVLFGEIRATPLRVSSADVWRRCGGDIICGIVAGVRVVELGSSRNCSFDGLSPYVDPSA